MTDLRELIEGLLNAANHYHFCSYPESVEFRCVLCQKAESAEQYLRETKNEHRQNH